MSFEFVIEDTDLFKAVGSAHKYVKRTGGPGNYKYWYKLPNGNLVSSDDAQSPVKHPQAQIEHLRRLIHARAAGHHQMTKEQMLAHTGLTRDKLKEAGNKHIFENAPRRPHNFEPHELQEAHQNEGARARVESLRDARQTEARAGTPRPRTDTSRANARVAGARSPDHAAAMTSLRQARARSAAGAATSADTEPGANGRNSNAEAMGRNEGGTAFSTSEQSDLHSKVKRAVERLSSGVEKVHEPEVYDNGKSLYILVDHDKQDGEIFEPRPGEEDDDFPNFVGRQKVINAVQAAVGDKFKVTANEQEKGMFSVEIKKKAEAPKEKTEEQKLLEKLQKEHGVDLTSAAASARPTSPAVVEASRVKARRAATPGSPAYRAVTQADPDFAHADAPVARAVQIQQDGGNPYFERSKEIFDRIKGDLKPGRKAAIGHIFQAISNLKAQGKPLNEANLVDEYKALSGARVRGLSGLSSEFEKGTFHTLDEVIGNTPIDPEVERMKRGYAAKQMARMKPFIKDSWISSHAGAPPPYPTFGDVKTWNEHGGAKPSWAGTTRLALPKDVFDASHKGADGKPMYPPAWMPINMMPAWNYVAKRSTNEGNSPYQGAPIPLGQDQKLRLGNSAQFQEGIVKSALRKYVQMRGGADQLTDIPKSKLVEQGMTHAEIYRSDDEDASMKKILDSKIIDPVALQPYIDEALKEAGSETKKSFELVVEETEAYIPLYKQEMALKAFMIERIRAAKSRHR